MDYNCLFDSESVCDRNKERESSFDSAAEASLVFK